MSAANAANRPPAEGEATGSSDDEGWALLEGLRRRIDDQAILARKTQQQVAQLTDSIVALVEVQRRRDRHINLNSFVAYLIFTVLCATGFYLLYQSRADELADRAEHAAGARDVAAARADELAAKLVAREQAEGAAWEVYQLLEAGKRNDAATKLDRLRDAPLSRTERALLAARSHDTSVQSGEAALATATSAFRQGRFGDVIAPLEAALVSERDAKRASAMRYFLGIAHAKAGALDKAVALLQVAVDANVEHDDARFQLASALDRSGLPARAHDEYERFARQFPQSQFAAFAIRRAAVLATVARPAGTAASTTPAPAAPTTTPQATDAGAP